ncbi:hypothetical protein PAAG_02040 [Paracoccidioides lutzii Pb01]|uniref:Uncharacterized protein n=1 Tax=Paracoccidioides lutzii (strain ATCC MYA-826 / Pb01) TaxID=502779 RepID=C1GU45_PARBA|nr:hypothetical protein PAAG_02040 [Paracoccidioides lutzii Pb01]EEH39851.1 hypothetical protein PAAG_02040 [Paracoccidioides lutzii Pb01]
MDIKVLIQSGDILDLYRDSSRVLQALADDGWIVLKNAKDTNSVELVADNQHVRYLMRPDFLSDLPFLVPASLLDNSSFEHFPEWEKFADKKDEVLCVTAYHLHRKDNKSRWRWHYYIGDREGNQPKCIPANGGDVYAKPKPQTASLPLASYRIICSGWLLRQLPWPEDQADLFVVNYRRSDYHWENVG